MSGKVVRRSVCPHKTEVCHIRVAFLQQTVISLTITSLFAGH